jgi:carboxyl-terminal processing protease
MRNKVPIPILAFAGFLVFAAVFAAGFAAALLIDQRMDATSTADNASFGLFWEAWELVRKDFYGDLPDAQQVTYSALRGALGALNDPYSVLVEPQPREMERDSLRGSFGGIGAYVSKTDDGQFVLLPIEGQPAQAAGVQEGDVLLAVDGTPVSSGSSVEDVVLAIRGPVGEPVTLTIRHPGAEEAADVIITRAVIELPSARWEVLEQAPDIGYIQLNRFSEKSGLEVETAIKELTEAGAGMLILDLRFNGGGLLNSAVDVLDHFFGRQTVVYQLSSGGKETGLTTSRGGIAEDIPLAVLVNSGTASASEIVAGALQDLGRAQLVGETTFGKGSVQNVYDLSDGSSLHLTSSRWYTPNRRQLDGQGLTPDIPVSLDDSGDDLQLERAIELMQTGQ